MKKYVIIGNGVAGDSAVVKIRKLDSEGTIDIFTTEDVPFYYRPRLIDYLAKEVTFKQIKLHPDNWYEDNKINLHFSSEIVSIDPEKKKVVTGDGEIFTYDSLLIATGADCNVPPIKGVEENKDKILTLKSRFDADKILEKASTSKEVILIGGGLLGLETGNSLIKLGLKVKVVEFFSRLLPRQLDPEGAGILEKQLSSMGFEFFLNKVSDNIQSSNNHLKLTLKSGEILEGHMIIISAGIKADLRLPLKAGLKVNRGILVDDYMKTSIDDIYSAGDITEHNGRLYGIWQPAKEQGEIAGENMAGGKKEYKGTLFSHKLKVVGLDLVSSGEIDTDGKFESIVKKDYDKFIYKKAVISDGKIIGCIMLGNIDGEKQVSMAIKEGKNFEEVKEFF
jgi:nitrite reductase (NADH) large subunit